MIFPSHQISNKLTICILALAASIAITTILQTTERSFYPRPTFAFLSPLSDPRSFFLFSFRKFNDNGDGDFFYFLYFLMEIFFFIVHSFFLPCDGDFISFLLSRLRFCFENISAFVLQIKNKRKNSRKSSQQSTVPVS